MSGQRIMKGALVGCGYIAPRHLRAWANVPDGELVAVCDLDRARAEDRAREWGIPAVYDSVDILIAELGDDLDFVDISVPPELHRAIVDQALGHGLHVLCQKPMAHTLEDSIAIVELAAASDRTVAINEMWKWIPAYEHVWREIRDDRIGTVRSLRFTGASNLLLPRRAGVVFPEVTDKESSAVRAALVQRFAPMRELIILEYGVHILDMLRAWFGEPTALKATTSRVNPELAGDDAASIRLRFDGFDAELYLDWCRPGPETGDNIDGESLAVLGSEGLLTVTAGKWFVWHPAEGEPITTRYPQDTRDAGFQRSHADFARCAISGAKPASSPDDNLRSQSLVLACYESARRSGEWVSAPSDFIQGLPVTPSVG